MTSKARAAAPEESAPAEGSVADTLRWHGARVLVGACSWADASLARNGAWYPRRTMRAAERLAFYASKLPVAEVASTGYFPPTPEVCQGWVDRSPDGFVLHLAGWSLLCGAPTLPASLWPDLAATLPPEHQGKPRLYAGHLATDVLDECWLRFLHGIGPLRRAGRLGGVVLTYPRWFGPGPAQRADVAAQVGRLDGIAPAFVSLRNPGWFRDDQCEATLEFLEDLGAPIVCSDRVGGDGLDSHWTAGDWAAGDRARQRSHGDPGPSAPPRRPVVAATAEVAMVRFAGQWRPEPAVPSAPLAKGEQRPGSTESDDGEHDLSSGSALQDEVPGGESHWRPAPYGRGVLAGWMGELAALASSVTELHVLFANCWEARAVTDARTMIELILEAGADSRPYLADAAPPGRRRSDGAKDTDA
ncbi:MAG: DUF72 domain-containing protein [Acidimicrobiales bacterium]